MRCKFPLKESPEVLKRCDTNSILQSGEFQFGKCSSLHKQYLNGPIDGHLARAVFSIAPMPAQVSLFRRRASEGFRGVRYEEKFAIVDTDYCLRKIIKVFCLRKLVTLTISKVSHNASQTEKDFTATAFSSAPAANPQTRNWRSPSRDVSYTSETFPSSP